MWSGDNKFDNAPGNQSKIKDVIINFNKERDICRALKMLKDYQGAFYKFYRVPVLH